MKIKRSEGLREVDFLFLDFIYMKTLLNSRDALISFYHYPMDLLKLKCLMIGFWMGLWIHYIQSCFIRVGVDVAWQMAPGMMLILVYIFLGYSELLGHSPQIVMCDYK